jgi:hypothetical protein
MNIDKFYAIAADELNNPTWGCSKQFLEVNTIEKAGEKYIYDRFRVCDNEISFYFKVLDEEYYFSISIDMNKSDIVSVAAINGNKCYLTATSDELSLSELAKITKLKYTAGWSKGDVRKNGSIYDFSRINFEFYDKTSYESEEILPLVLDELEKDREGVIELSQKAYAYIAVCKYQYVSANAGISVDEAIIKRLNNLNLGIDIDMYIVGPEFKFGSD